MLYVQRFCCSRSRDLQGLLAEQADQVPEDKRSEPTSVLNRNRRNNVQCVESRIIKLRLGMK